MPMRPAFVTNCAILLGLLLALLVTGCGQKGDLYLPDEPDARAFRQAR